MVGRRAERASRHRLKPLLQAMNGNLSLEQRYLEVTARIRESALAAGRDPGSVRLLAVSKTFPADRIEELVRAGQFAFGENYLQEALGKIAALERVRPGRSLPGPSLPGRSLEWHFIGPIQSNKTRRIAESFAWAQSVDDEKIARRLSAQRPGHLPPLEVCLQVNVSGEASKSGCEPERVGELAREVAQLPQLRLRGLMAIPEATTDTKLQARQFGQLRRLFEAVRDELKDHRDADVCMDTLSMGMSSDLEVAIAEGATLVRIGSALFGARTGVI